MNVLANRTYALVQKYARILAILMVCMPSVGSAESQCGRAGEIHILVANLKNLTWRSERLTQNEARLISRRISAVYSSGLLPRLNELGRVAERRTISQLLAAAIKISKSGEVRDPAALQRLLQSTERAIARTCQYNGQSSFDRSADFENSRGIQNPINRMSLGEYITQAKPLMKIALLLALLVFLAGAAMCINVIYATLYALAFNRKSCRVKASLIFGAVEFEGYIIVLGKNGCRFEPADRAALHQTKELIRHPNPQIKVLDLTLPIRLNGITDVFVSIFFNTPVPHANLKTILATSLSTPHYVKKDIMKSNLKDIASA